jgi:hypothetical protein
VLPGRKTDEKSKAFHTPGSQASRTCRHEAVPMRKCSCYLFRLKIPAVPPGIPPQTIPAKLVIRLPAPNPLKEDQTEDSEKQERNRRTFCPPEYRERILRMMERHYCAHPLIPGYSAPSPVAIRRWAVHQMYMFCAGYDLSEVWAYLWENWYRRGRWELWARSAHTEIPLLKTTMMLEGQ